MHLLPYWEGVSVDTAVDYSFAQFRRLQKAFPGKPVMVAEIGWPSRGRTREYAVASDSNEALFLRRFLKRAEKEQIVYYVMEAFDQPWKAYQEGAVGSYWGVYDVEPQCRSSTSRPAIVRVPEWHMLAAISVAVALARVVRLLFEQRDAAAQPGAQLPGAGGVHGRHDRGLGVLRLHPAVHDGLERRFRRAAAAGHVGCHPRAARRGARMGRGALGDLAPAPGAARSARTDSRSRRCPSTCRPTTSRRTW